MLCYIGKATKIFIFIIAVIAITGLVIGFGIYRHNSHPKSHKCSGEYCSFSYYSPPPQLQIPVQSLPDPNASNPSDSTNNPNSPPPPPPPALLETSIPPPPPVPETSLQPPAPPTPVSVVTAAPPQAFSPPSPVQVSPGPMNSS